MRLFPGLAGSLLVLGGSLAMAQPVTSSDIENAASDNSSWLTYGRDYYGQRFVRPRTSTGSIPPGCSRPAARTAVSRRLP
jgi:hypothetical protein